MAKEVNNQLNKIAADPTVTDETVNQPNPIPSVASYMGVAANLNLSNLDLNAVKTTLLFQQTAYGVLGNLGAQLAHYGLSDGKFGLLMNYFIQDAEEQQLSPSELAAHCGVTRGTITGLLDGLERDNLIVRKPDLQDRRKLVICLTETGFALMAQLLPDYFARTAALMQHLDKDEQTQLVALLGKVYNGIKPL